MDWNEEMSNADEDSKYESLAHKDPEFTLYKLLNVEKTANEQEISKLVVIYRKSLLKD